MLRRRGGRPSRRDDIVRAAAEAFAASGYHNTSLNNIAEQLSMTPAGILHHFGSKENLLTEVLEFRDELSREQQAKTGQALLDHLIDTARRNEANPGLTQLYAVLSAESVAPGHPAQEWFRERYTTVRRDVEDALRESAGLAEGERTVESALAARAVIAAMDGLQVQWLLDPDVHMADALHWVAESMIERLRS